MSSTTSVPSSQPNIFLRTVRTIYKPLGFQTGHAFTLFFILAGALTGFTLARLQYLAYDTTLCPSSVDDQGAAPGECFHYGRGASRIGLIIHLGAVLPASLLAVVQFVPAVRHRAITFHRVNGYLVVMLGVVSTAGAFAAARRAFGGGLDVQGAVGLLGIMFLVALGMAVWNIRKKQIEEHRAWMLRAWVYSGSIITTRLIMILAAMIITRVGTYRLVKSCALVAYVVDNETETLQDFPSCAGYLSGDEPDAWAAVKADMDGGGAAGAMAALDMSFGMAIWLALAIHAIGVEVYLHLTPKEHERLRMVSYQRQLKAGMRSPGSAGLTGDKLGHGDKWMPRPDVEEVAGDSTDS